VASKNDYLKRLEKAIHDLHGAKAIHVGTTPVTEKFHGKVVWQGEVEAFTITGHPEARMCYAWSYQDGNTEHFAAVLAIPPIRTEADAVKAYIVAEMRKQKSN
jgi:hypothetical protein